MIDFRSNEMQKETEETTRRRPVLDLSWLLVVDLLTSARVNCPDNKVETFDCWLRGVS